MKAQTSLALIVLVVVLAIVALLVLIFIGIYNGLISLDVNAENAWANVQTQYQRRFDLIPNLVNAAKGYMTYEKGLLVEVTELRSQWGAAKTRDEQIAAADSLDSAISRLLAVVEQYPDLKAMESVKTLMTQLEGTENRISVARFDFNAAVKDFNFAIRTFPSNMVAGMMGLQKKSFFESDEAAANAPVVNLTIS